MPCLASPVCKLFAETPLQEVEETLVEFLEKGAIVESDVLANVKTVLPAEVRLA